MISARTGIQTTNTRIIDSVHTVSLILVSYNANSLTRQCLDSLRLIDRSEIDLHVVVVDNASKTPFTLDATDQKYYRTEVLRSEANLGFTGGNNLGIHYAVEQHNPDYVLLLNNDTTVSVDFLQLLLQAMEDDSKNFGIVSPKIFFAPGREFHRKSYPKTDRGKIIWYAGGSIDWDNFAAFHRGVDEIDRGQFGSITTSDFATGCCLMVRREVLEKIGLLDKRYFMYFEDVDWSMKALAFGYDVGFVEEAHIWHINAGSSDGSGSTLHQYYQTRNMLLFFSEYGTWRDKLRLIRVMTDLIKSNNQYLRKAVIDFLLRQFGKQPVYI